MAHIHQRLKDATQKPHRILDGHRLFRSLFSSPVTLGGIQQALQFWWGFHCAVADANNSFGCVELVPYLNHEDKINALKRDMARFNVPVAKNAIEWPRVHCLADLVALLYVSEGSLLGGLAINKVLHKHNRPLGVQIDFLTVYEPGTPARWHQFLQVLQQVSETIEPSIAERSAVAWFDALIQFADDLCMQCTLAEETLVDY